MERVNRCGNGIGRKKLSRRGAGYLMRGEGSWKGVQKERGKKGRDSGNEREKGIVEKSESLRDWSEKK